VLRISASCNVACPNGGKIKPRSQHSEDKIESKPPAQGSGELSIAPGQVCESALGGPWADQYRIPATCATFRWSVGGPVSDHRNWCNLAWSLAKWMESPMWLCCLFRQTQHTHPLHSAVGCGQPNSHHTKPKTIHEHPFQVARVTPVGVGTPCRFPMHVSCQNALVRGGLPAETIA
jgi:hypothetical protein